MGIDRTNLESAVRRGLPGRARWMLDETPLDFTFAVATRGLGALPEAATWPDHEEACDLFPFGEQDYAEGGGAHPWLCVRGRDGAVVGYDLERIEPVFLLNTSIDRFIATFQLFDRRLGSAPQRVPDLESLTRSIDPEAYPTSEWRLLLERLRGG